MIAVLAIVTEDGALEATRPGEIVTRAVALEITRSALETVTEDGAHEVTTQPVLDEQTELS